MMLYLECFSVVFQVMFSIIAMNVFQLQAAQNGYLMAYFGVVQMVHKNMHLPVEA